MDYSNYLQFFLTLIFIIGLILGIALLARRFGFAQNPMITGNKKKRLRIKEVRPLDARRKMVLIQCDDKEHLLLIGGTQDLHIDSNFCLDQPPLKTEQVNKKATNGAIARNSIS